MHIIGISGGSASGKTSIATKLYEKSLKFGSVSVIRLDDYYKDLSHLTMEERKKINYDHPESIDFDRLIHDLVQLKNGIAIKKPIYDFVAHNRSNNFEEIESVHVVIVEGILTFVDPILRALFDIKIYVDTEDDLRFIRRLQRDISKRGRTLESVISQYLSTVRPMHLQFVEPSKKYADMIIPEGGQNNVAIDIILTKISSICEQ